MARATRKATVAESTLNYLNAAGTRIELAPAIERAVEERRQPGGPQPLDDVGAGPRVLLGAA